MVNILLIVLTSETMLTVYLTTHRASVRSGCTLQVNPAVQ